MLSGGAAAAGGLRLDTGGTRQGNRYAMPNASIMLCPPRVNRKARPPPSAPAAAALLRPPLPFPLCKGRTCSRFPSGGGSSGGGSGIGTLCLAPCLLRQSAPIACGRAAAQRARRLRGMQEPEGGGGAALAVNTRNRDQIKKRKRLLAGRLGCRIRARTRPSDGHGHRPGKNGEKKAQAKVPIFFLTN